MTAAIFGLLGVIVGGLLNGGVAYWMEHRRERHGIRAACRLVEDELSTNFTVIRLAGEHNDLEYIARIKADAWQQHSPLLARGFDDGEWAMVTIAYKACDTASEFGNRPGDAPPMSDEERTAILGSGMLPSMLPTMHMALERLRRRATPTVEPREWDFTDFDPVGDARRRREKKSDADAEH